MSHTRRPSATPRCGMKGLGEVALLGIGFLPLLFGQPTVSSAFDVTSVKPNKLPPRELIVQVSCSGGRFLALGHSVNNLIKWAYQIDQSSLVGLPGWADDDGPRYDIEAKGPGAVNDDRCRPMVKALLAERFKLKAHLEQRQTPILALIVAKGGVKMQKATESDPPNSVKFLYDGQPMQMLDAKLKGWTMDQLTSILTIGRLGRPVLNRTGLEGAYRFTMAIRHPGSTDDQWPDLPGALQELGLKLDARNEMVQKVVIDHVERPDAN